MAKILTLSFLVLFTLPLCLVFSASAAQLCDSGSFSMGNEFGACSDLPALNSSIHWNYHSSTHSVDVAFRRSGIRCSSSWIAWAINPTSHGMIGSQAIVAFQRTDGTLTAYTSPITSYGTQMQRGNLSFPVYEVSAAYNNQEMVIFATIQLPSNTTVVNHVWQDGPMFGDTPSIHSISGLHLQSFGTLDFLSGQLTTKNGTLTATNKLKLTHGILNAVSWGFLMPVGAIIARYVKVFQVADPAWFYLHVGCQSSAYFIGVAGGIMGFWLGHKSPGIQYKLHRDIGIALLCLASFQVVLARFFRPKKGHDLRFYWNICHYSVGYGTIGLSIWNVFNGIKILDSDKWTTAYAAIIISLGCVAVLLEAFTWAYVCFKKRSECSNASEA